MTCSLETKKFIATIQTGALCAAIFLTSACAAPTSVSEFRAQFVPTRDIIDKWPALDTDNPHRLVDGQSIADINTAVNRVPYRHETIDLWKRPDVFFAEGGDCEDYAIAKYFELASRGIGPAWLAVVHDPFEQKFHAVLAVSDQGRIVVLDNRSSRPIPWATYRARYKPIYILDPRSGEVRRDTDYSG